MTTSNNSIGGAAQARHEVVWRHAKPILQFLDMTMEQVRDAPPLDRSGEEDRSLMFAAASLKALILEAASEAWDDPFSEGEAENMLFAELGDAAPDSYEYEIIGGRLEGVGERQQRYNIGLKRINDIIEAVVVDAPAFRRRIAKMLEEITTRSPVKAIAGVRRDPIRVRSEAGQLLAAQPRKRVRTKAARQAAAERAAAQANDGKVVAITKATRKADQAKAGKGEERQPGHEGGLDLPLFRLYN